MPDEQFTVVRARRADHHLARVQGHGGAELVAALAAEDAVMLWDTTEMFVFMAFQGEGVRLITKGGADGVQAEAFPPLTELIATIGEFGGLLAPCSPCLENRGLSEDDLIEHLRPRVAKWWLPDRVIFIDEIPKTGTGKFDKKVVRDQYSDLLTE